MATLDTQQVQATGTAITYVAATAGGDKIRPSGPAIHVKNASAAAVTVTIVTPNTVQGQAIGDIAISVPAGAERMAGPFPARDFANTADGLVDITYSAVASVTVAAIRI